MHHISIIPKAIPFILLYGFTIKTNICLPTPDYLHAQQAFGVWSLPDRSTSFRARVEDRLDAYIDFYRKAIMKIVWCGQQYSRF